MTDARREAVLELAGRYCYDAEHAHQVECMAGTLFLALQPLHQLGREERKLLEYAAILHDIGYFLSTRGHHRHAMHLILTEPWTVLTRSEAGVVANLARYHRKAPPSVMHTAFAVLSEEDQRRVLLLAPLLRIADALDRSHSSLVQELQPDLQPDALVLRVGAVRDVPMEAEALERKQGLFQEVYGCPVRLSVHIV